MKKILLCCDLDRTLLPNGAQVESAQARPLLRRLAARPEVALAYVSGRNLELLQDAIAEYDIPQPDFAIGDVGTSLYQVQDDQWLPVQAWTDAIAPDWHGVTHDDLAALFADCDALYLQPPDKQSPFKLSYYVPLDMDVPALLVDMEARLNANEVRATLVWSIDEPANIGLLDILPEEATKLHAVRFLMMREGFSVEDTVFAGDSGNDLPVMVSELQSVLVRNASADVVSSALAQTKQNGLQHRLYLAQGDFLGMNGNYSAGVLEGLVHYIPEVRDWLVARGLIYA